MSDWFNRNTDKLVLYSLVILAGIFMLHVIHHAHPDTQLLTWLENEFSTILGALILILTGRVARANGNGNGSGADTTAAPQAPAKLAPRSALGVTGAVGVTGELGTNAPESR